MDTSTFIRKSFFTIMNTFTEIETELIWERVLSGLEAAKANGKTLGRPPENKYIDEIVHDYLYTNLPVTEISTKYGVSRPTIYRYLKNNNIPLRQ
ncbi:recombinase family protein [Enterococcus faecalis]|uniref:recombinase family protein n=1 Tax=Enterococcus faecalis TaxID=1351 RepID=UPI0025AEFC0E|nr:recombinase family protein [Enterococcus faecalis]MDN3185232.1 recombinase family protein [Enterococcus faecalis]